MTVEIAKKPKPAADGRKSFMQKMLDGIEKVGNKVKDLLHGTSCAGRKGRAGKAALVITHTGQILDYIEADRGYVMCNGTVMCSGNPRELLQEISKMGYEECIKCKLKLTTVN